MRTVAGWRGLSWLRHGFTERAGGLSEAYGLRELNLGFTREDAPERVRGNRARVAAELGAMRIATVRQVHGTRIVRASAAVAEPEEADALLTDAPGVLLGIMTADCVPVLLADTRRRAVAAVHAGWRGTAAGIAALAVAAMQREFGSEPADLIAAVGPSIGPCCYEVGPEVASRFASELSRKGLLDLWEANRRQLAEAGVPDVAVLGECTACARTDAGERRYFSYRAEAGVTGRMMGLVGVC